MAIVSQFPHNRQVVPFVNFQNENALHSEFFENTVSMQTLTTQVAAVYYHVGEV